MSYRIALVDDRPQNLISIAERLQYTGEVNICLQARNGKEYLDIMKRLEPAERPEVVLMDIDMPLMDGIEAVRQGHILYPECRYIMLTVFDDDDKLFEAIQAGAGGYLLKEEPTETILAAIREVSEQSGAPMSPRIARKALNLLRQSPGPQSSEGNEPKATGLSDREMDILQELVNGLDYRQIGAKLFISPHTVRKHISNIYTKLHVTSRAQAVKLAVKNKWGV